MDQKASEIKHFNATSEQCKERCEDDSKCVSFEFCHYWCDPEYGFPYANQCIINYKSFPQGDAPANFFQCSKGKGVCICLKLVQKRVSYFTKFGSPILSYL